MRRCKIISSLYLDRRLIRAGRERWLAIHWLLAISVGALVAATWRLWTPQQIFPQVPLIGTGHWLPTSLDWPLLAIFVTAPVVAAVSCNRDRVRRGALIAFVVAAALLTIADQHRLQPWAYQFALVALVLALTTPARALALARVLTIGIYLHSALSKFDYSFLHELGPQMVVPLMDAVGIAPNTTNTWLVAAALPAGELLVACGLLFRPARTLALAVSVVMHIVLLVVLGPLGLDHSRGVLFWNVFFIAQNVVLFFPLKKQPKHSRSIHCRSRGRIPRTCGLATGIIFTALVPPFAAPWGWFDMWPSWGLYASRAERSSVLIRFSSDSSIPAELRPHLRDVPDSPGWRQLDLQSWSLATLHAPVYPQNRFQLGVALAVAESLDKHTQIGVLLRDQSSRWSADRQTHQFFGRLKIRQAAAKYLLQTNPRANWTPTTANRPET